MVIKHTHREELPFGLTPDGEDPEEGTPPEDEETQLGRLSTSPDPRRMDEKGGETVILSRGGLLEIIIHQK